MADFGLARAVEGEHSYTQGFIGTPRYTSPEQARDEEATPASDVFSFGCVAYELLTGRRAFRGGTPRAVLNDVQYRDLVWPTQGHYPRDARTVVEKCLEKDPRDRYPNAADVESELLRVLEYEPVLANSRGFLSRTWKRARRRPLRLAVGLLATVTTVLALALLQVQTSAARARALENQERRFDTALEWFHQADFGRAQDALADLVAEDGRPTEYLEWLAFATYAEFRESDEAVHLYEAADNERPSMVSEIGLALTRGEIPEPPPVTERALSEIERAHLFLARLVAGDFLGAEIEARKARESSPTSAVWRRNRGEALMACGRTAEAHDELEAAQHLAPRSESILVQLSAAKRTLLKFTEAESLVLTALEVHPESERLVLELAYAMLAQGEIDEARKEAERALNLRSGWSPSQALLIQVLAQSFDWRDDLEHYLRECNARKSEDPELIHATGWADFWRQDYESALKQARRLSAVPGVSWAEPYSLGLAGRVYRETGDNVAALETYSRLMELQPETVDWALSVGVIHYEEGRLDEAQAALERVQAFAPRGVATLRLAGNLHRSRGEYWEAIRAFEAAMGADPSYESTLAFEIARAWEDLGQPGVALRYVDISLERWPDWYWARIVRALCLEGVGVLWQI